MHGGFLAVFFDPVIQHHNCDVGRGRQDHPLERPLPAPTPLLTPAALRHRARRSTDGGSTRPPGSSADGDVLCEAQMRAVAGTARALPRGLSAATRDDGRGDRRRRRPSAHDPARCCARGSRSAAAAVRRVRRRRRSPTRDAERRSARARARPARRRRRQGHARRPAPPERQPSSSVAWLAAARIGAVAVPFSTFSTAAELARAAAQRRRRAAARGASYRSHDYASRAARGRRRARPRRRPPLFAAVASGAAPDPLRRPRRGASIRAGRRGRSRSAARSIDADVLAAVEAAVRRRRTG